MGGAPATRALPSAGQGAYAGLSGAAAGCSFAPDASGHATPGPGDKYQQQPPASQPALSPGRIDSLAVAGPDEPDDDEQRRDFADHGHVAGDEDDAAVFANGA